MNSGYDGGVGYGGALDIRPKFQREFVYDTARQQAVITTILSGFPLNVMYWSKRTDPVTGKASFEMLDRAAAIDVHLIGQSGHWPEALHRAAIRRIPAIQP